MIRATPLSEFINRPRPTYLVKGILPRHGLGVIYGEPGSGKTFLAFDMGMAIARGETWRGHRVPKNAGVVYVCAEGTSGFADRARAYLKHHGLNPDDVSFEVIASPVNLLNPGKQFDQLVTAIKDASERIGPIGVIMVDTLNRTMPGGDENSADDMGLFITNVSRLAEAVKAFALIVHHSGKDATRGARGHSSLKAAVDLEIEVTRNEGGDHVATITKARDFESGAQFAFRLEVVDLGNDDDGDQITSCVLVPAEVPTGTRRGRELSGVARVALAALKESIAEHGQSMPETSSIPPHVRAVRLADWRNRFLLRYGTDGGRTDAAVTKAFVRGKEQLFKAGLVCISDPFAWMT